MASSIALTVALGVLIISAVKLIIYPAFLSPLAKIPCAHWSSRFCPAWILWKRWCHGENQAVRALHAKHGPVIRLSPYLLSVSCYEDGVKTIYQGGFPKPPFYFAGFATYGIHNIFTFGDNQVHAARKRTISHTFSKSYILSSETAHAAVRDVVYGRYLPALYAAASTQNKKNGRPVEMLEMNYAVSMDVFVQWQFGRLLGSNFIQDAQERKMYLDGFFATHGYTFWQYYFLGFATSLRRIGIYLIPKAVDKAFQWLEEWNLNKCDQAQELLAAKRVELPIEDKPVVFEQALISMSRVGSPSKNYPARMDIAGDMFAHSSAAFETSGNTETYLFFEMCRNPQWQTRLREELLTLSSAAKYVPGKTGERAPLPSAKELDTLPILNAVIMETLRRWPSVPGGQPRVVPKPCTLGGYHGIPAGTIVQSYACVLHNNPQIFPDPDQWKPERWLEASPAELARMHKWFWAFGSGGRMCIGSHFAFYAMKAVVAAVYSNFTTSIHDHGDMELIDAYLAGPAGHRLELIFHSLDYD